MRDIETRADIDAVLRAFYTRAIDDALLRHVFVEVANMDLEEHLPAIGNFWEKVLFSTSEYNGDAMHVHRHLHDKEPLKPAHFERCGTRPSAHTTRGPPPPEPSSTPPASSWPCSATSTRRPCTDQPAGRRARDQGSRWRTRRADPPGGSPPHVAIGAGTSEVLRAYVEQAKEKECSHDHE